VTPPLLPADRVDAELAGTGWRREGDHITTEVVLADFAAAVAFVNAVAALAEEQGHHPDIDIRWNRVRLTVTTHDAGGLTDRDLQLARAVEAARPVAG
jgi:4a-hydroxytetrahydrobiopterin dehydratase